MNSFMHRWRSNTMAFSGTTRSSGQKIRLERYRAKADPIIALIGAFYLVLLLIPRAIITSWDSSTVITLLDIVFWSIITLDLAMRCWLASIRRERIPLLIALLLLLSGPFVFLSIPPETRVLIRMALIAVVSLRAIHSVRYFFRLRSIVYIIAAVILIVLVFAIIMTSVEKNAPHANITSLGLGLWWAVSTISTVGYGDAYPVTETGRIIAATLMFFGIVMFSILTATLARSFVRREEESPTGEFASLHERLERIEQNQLRAQPARHIPARSGSGRRTKPPRIGKRPPDSKE